MTRKMTTHMSWRQYADVLSEREPFRTGGALRGERVDDYPHRVFATGRLPQEWRQMFLSTPVDYAVFSYETPIAWHDKVRGEWTVPPVTYSVTTSRHQGRIATAIRVISR